MIKKFYFPDPKTVDTIEDIITVGGEINKETIIEAYELGIFPWPHKGYPLLWFCPDQRGIINFDQLHIGRSLSKWIKKNEHSIEIKLNKHLPQVIKECRLQKRHGQKGSWINSDIEKVYSQLGETKNVIAIECYRNEILISGIYGVLSKNYFSCESMFYKIDNASKYAFIKLIEYLKQNGHSWMDLQMVTEVCASLGAIYITKKEFLKRIENKIKPIKIKG